MMKGKPRAVGRTANWARAGKSCRGGSLNCRLVRAGGQASLPTGRPTLLKGLPAQRGGSLACKGVVCPKACTGDSLN